MNKEQKSRLGRLILMLIYLVLASGLGYMFILNEKLSSRAEIQAGILKRYNLNDSTLKSDAEDIKRDLNNISTSFTYIKNGKKLSGEALVSFIHKIEHERDSIKYMYDYAQQSYGFEIRSNAKRNKNGITTTISAKPGTRADSAGITYQFFRDRIYKKNGIWHADQTSKNDLKSIEKAINDKLMPEVRDILESQKDSSKNIQ